MVEQQEKIMAEGLSEVQVRAFEHAHNLFDRYVEDAVCDRQLGSVEVRERVEGEETQVVTINGDSPYRYLKRHLGFTTTDEEFIEASATYFEEAMSEMWQDTMDALAELEVGIQQLAVSSTAGYLDAARALHDEVKGLGEPDATEDEVLIVSRGLVHAALLEWRDAEKAEAVQPVEIERKFLVAELPEGLENFDRKTIRQGYMVIGADGSEARLRDKAGSFTLTVKSKGELSRGEWETPITEEQFEALWGTTVGKRVEKTRYAIPHNGHIIELDIYEGDLTGLISAEVEFDSEAGAEAFEAPEWFGDDVTSNSDYKNQNLALKGLPQ